MPYNYVEDITVADVAFEATGKTIEELFVSCAEATFSVMTDIKKIKPTYTTTFTLKNDNLEKLLFEFIEELIYYKDAEAVLFSKFSIIISEHYTLECTAEGSEIKNIKETQSDVKAITMHHFFLKKEKEEWKARIILDI